MDVEVIEVEVIGAVPHNVETDQIATNVHNLRVIGIVCLKEPIARSVWIKPPDGFKAWPHRLHADCREARWFDICRVGNRDLMHRRYMR